MGTSALFRGKKKAKKAKKKSRAFLANCVEMSARRFVVKIAKESNGKESDERRTQVNKMKAKPLKAKPQI